MTFFRVYSGSKLGCCALHYLSLAGAIFSVLISVALVDAAESWVRESITSFYEPLKTGYREQRVPVENANHVNLPGTLSVRGRVKGSFEEFLQALLIRSNSDCIFVGARVPKAGSTSLSHYFGCIINPVWKCGTNLARNDKFVGRFISRNENRADSQVGFRNGALSFKISKQIKV